MLDFFYFNSSGDLRFQAPVAPEGWSGIRDAFRFSSQCWQPVYSPTSLVTSEDCLYLNIYTPVRDRSVGLLPVMVWIHGGSFLVGSGSIYNGTRLARQGDLVVVTINYRLGVFGFLSTEDSVMPGNYGLLDQIQALKWIRDNIANFGGDSTSVTIFGESAGSNCVSLLVVSPLAKGLFHRAIMESGVSVRPWGHTQNTQRLAPLYGARLVGGAGGCAHVFGQSHSFLRCLRGLDAQTLTDAATNVSKLVFDHMWLLPREEKTFGVLPDDPVEMWTRGDFNEVDTIRGFNSHERGEIKIRNGTTVDTKEAFIESLQAAFKPYAFSGVDDLINMFVDVYLGNNNNSDFIAQKACEALSDFAYVGPTLVELQLMVAKLVNKKHFLYRYGYRDSFSRAPSWVGAVHAVELRHVFGIDQLDPQTFRLTGIAASPQDTAMTDLMITMWSDFAKTGDPTASVPSLTWPPFTSARQWMLNINTSLRVTEFSRPKIVELCHRVLLLLQGTGKHAEGIVG